MKETIDLLGKILTNILTALYVPFGFSLLLSFLAMFFYLYIKSVFIIIAGIITCIIWGFFIRHFRLLKTSKFKVIAQLETKLPEAPFIDEWEDLKSSKKYIDGTDLEQLLPITFSVMYIVAIIIISRGR